MTATESPTMVVPVPLDQLGSKTKDFLLAHANEGMSPAELMMGLMARAAEREGFLSDGEKEAGK